MSGINFFVGGFPVLSETFVINQVAAVVEAGYPSTVVSLMPETSGAKHQAVQKLNLIDKRVYVYKSFDKQNRVLGFASALVNDLLSFKFHRLAWIPKAGVKGYMLGRVFSNVTGPVICHFGPMGADLASLKHLGIVKDVDIITIFHGYDMTEYQVIEKYKDAYKVLFQEGKVMLPVNDYFGRKLIELGCEKEKVVTQRMGVDLSQFSYIERYINTDYSQQDIELICVCRFVEKKGVPVLLKAMAELPVRYKLTLVGSGELESDFVELVKSLNLTDRVEMTGALTSEQVAQRLTKADAFILPSITAESGDQEGVPVSLMEAMAQGLLVFSSLHSGIPELISNDYSGFLSAEHDFRHLASQIQYAFEQLSAEQRQDIAEHAKDKVESDFNLAKLNQQLVELANHL